MSLTNEQLAEVKELAGLYYTPEDIAHILEVENVDDFCAEIKSNEGPIARAFLSGFKTAEVAFRKKLIATAMIGSSPAQTQVQKLIDKLNNDLMER